VANVKAEAAWRAGATGSGVTVAVVDSGVSRDTADLVGRISAASTDVVPGRNTPYVADSSHGTRVSGVIASNFNGQGTIGVAYESTILSIRTDISDCEEKNTDVCFSSSDLVRALDYAVAKGVKIINMSLGGDDRLFREEETFGPMIPIFAFDTEDEALQKANASDYGLASYLFTRDLDRAMRFSRRIEAGMCGVNTGLISTAVAPFGGVKQSGYGREGSIHGIDEYVDVKTVTLALR
jgi:hypothetical protein